MEHVMERIALFVDGSNAYATAKALRIFIDWKRLIAYWATRGTLVGAYYYTAMHPSGSENDFLRRQVDWMSYNGWTVVTKDVKIFVNKETGKTKVKGNMDLEMAMQAIDLVPYVDRMVLMTGDGDFRVVVEALQRRGKQVTVMSTIMTNPPMIADELRRITNTFIDVGDERVDIRRMRREEPERAPPAIALRIRRKLTM